MDKENTSNIETYWTTCHQELQKYTEKYIGYPKAFLSLIESQNYSLSWLICSHCKYSDHIASFIYSLETYFCQYGHNETFQHFLSTNGFSTILSSSYWYLLGSNYGKCVTTCEENN